MRNFLLEIKMIPLIKIPGINIDQRIIAGGGRNDYLPINGGRQDKAIVIVRMVADQIDPARRLKNAGCPRLVKIVAMESDCL